jgi:hypothetical protein
MNKHLSQDQFSKCALTPPDAEERKHLAACPECSADTERFRHAISSFRNAIRGRVEARVAAQPFVTAAARAGGVRVAKWRWAVAAAAAVLLIALPFFRRESKPQQTAAQISGESDPDAVMKRVNLHLGRTMPAAMEPVLSLIPGDELIKQSGGVQ